MTRLISQYELFFGVSEEEEADRLRARYGWQRACTLAHVFENTCPRPYRAFWFRVGWLLAAQNDGVLPATLHREREAPMPPKPIKLTVHIGDNEITRTEFLTWVRTRKVAKA